MTNKIDYYKMRLSEFRGRFKKELSETSECDCADAYNVYEYWCDCAESLAEGLVYEEAVEIKVELEALCSEFSARLNKKLEAHFEQPGG